MPLPTDVFTPRKADLNRQMYIERPILEEKLLSALDGDKYLIIHGESGNGKTWLYKKIFLDKNISYTVINLGSANVAGDVIDVIKQKLGELEHKDVDSREVTVTGQIGFMGTGGATHVKSVYELGEKAPLLKLFELIRAKAGTKKAVIVFDNFEQIVDSEKLMRQINGILLQADDDAYAKNKVKILIVGVPGNIKNLISSTTNAATISNRVTSLPEVGRLSEEQAGELMQRGFFEKLGLNCQLPHPDLYKKVSWITDRIAQHVHEVCLKIAEISVKDGMVITRKSIDGAVMDWQNETLEADCAVIENIMNSRDTKAGRKNQTLFALGLCDKEEFNYSDIESIVRREFPGGTSGVTLNMSGMLSSFSKSENRIIRKTAKGSAYRFVSPKYRMAIRALLRKTDSEKIEKSN